MKIYIEVDLKEEQPPKNGLYVYCIANGHHKSVGYWLNGNPELKGATHWLKEIDITDGLAITAIKMMS